MSTKNCKTCAKRFDVADGRVKLCADCRAKSPHASVFIGAYVPAGLKESLQRSAAAERRTVSQEITYRLERSLAGEAARSQEEVRA